MAHGDEAMELGVYVRRRLKSTVFTCDKRAVHDWKSMGSALTACHRTFREEL